VGLLINNLYEFFLLIIKKKKKKKKKKNKKKINMHKTNNVWCAMFYIIKWCDII